MRTFTLNIFLTTVLQFLACQCFAIDSCEQIYFQKLSPSIEMTSKLLKELGWNQMTPEYSEANLPDLADNARRTLEKTVLRGFTEDGIHQSTSYSIKPAENKSKSVRDLRSEKARLRDFRKAKARALEFVFANYKERREHWSDQFIQKLKHLADEYENESTYINIENLAYEDRLQKINDFDRSPRALIASIRLIKEKNGKLPVEDYLGFDMAANDYLKVEPGNFAINHLANDIAWIKLAIHMTAQMHRYRTLYGREPLFITYADSYSERLYGMLGFKPIPKEHLKFKTDMSNVEYDEATGSTRVLKNNVSWVPMYVDAKMMSELLDKRMQRAARNCTPGVIEKLKVIRDLAMVGANRDHSRMFIGRIKNSTNGNNTAYLKVQLENNIAQISIHKKSIITGITGGIKIPYPIPENYKTNMITSDFNASITYSLGVLTLQSVGSYTDISTGQKVLTTELDEIWIDSYLKSPTAIRTRERTGEKFEEVEISF